MMNIQNPSFPHPAYGYGNPMSQPEAMAQFPSEFFQSQFQQSAPVPNTPQRPSQFSQQSQGQIPPPLYQQFQQQQDQQHPGLFARPQDRGALTLTQGQQSRQPPINPHQRQQSTDPSGNAPTTPSQTPTPAPVQQSMMQQSPAAAQLGQSNSPAQAMRGSAPQASSAPNPQAVAREEERVTTLLEINSHLIQEVMSLQVQGRAGSSGQQSPTSPTAGSDPSNPGSSSPNEPSKRQLPSQEYADCMRRLQANLAYLAAIADANKKASSARPVGPAIMIPPPHLHSVNGLYQKLKALFPEASQTTLNKAMAVANAQAAKNSPMQAQGVS